MQGADSVNDHTETLIAAWVRWEQHPASRHATIAKTAALDAAGIDPNRAHDHIGAWRRAGYSISDAVQTLIHEET